MTALGRTTRRWLVAALALLAAVAFAGVLQRRAAARPAPTRTCYDCHQDARKAFARKFVHAPLKKEDCAACHLSHGFSQQLVLKKSPNELCFDCHGDLRKTAPAHPHEAFAKGDCIGCHDPHASDLPALVRAGGPTATCFSCHHETAQEATLADQHAPFKSGACAPARASLAPAEAWAE